MPWLQSDEKQVETIIINGGELLNEKDYRALYETMSTNYLLNASYRRFQDYIQENITAVLVLVGPGKWEVTDLRVRIEGDWAFASYKMRKAGEVIISVPDDTETEDIYRKLDGNGMTLLKTHQTPGITLRICRLDVNFNVRRTSSEISCSCAAIPPMACNQ